MVRRTEQQVDQPGRPQAEAGGPGHLRRLRAGQRDRLGDAEIARMVRQHPEAGLKLRRMQEAVRTAPERFRQYDGQKKSPATEPEGRQRASEKDRDVQSETLK